MIIFSTVRCNSERDLGFLNDNHRLNVLLTRARHGIVGIGCEKTLSEGSHLWKEWLENVKVIGDMYRLNKPRGREVDRSDGRDSRFNRLNESAQGGQFSVELTHAHYAAKSRQSSHPGWYSTNHGHAEGKT